MIRFLWSWFSSAFRCQLLPQSAIPGHPGTGSTEDIAKATTARTFLSPWVSYVPASASVPSPRVFFGRIMGASGELVDSAKAYAYCRALAAVSPRVRVFTIGKSEEGREILLLAIADEKGIAESGAIEGGDRGIGRPAQNRSRGRGKTDRDRAADRITSTRHCIPTRPGSTESVLELAYRLAVSGQPMIRGFRETWWC